MSVAGKPLDAYRTSGTSPTRGRRHNFRNEHRAAYNKWRNNREYCEEQPFYVYVDPKTRKAQRYAKPKQVGDSKQAKARYQAREDAHLRRYIEQVKAGIWPTKRVQITDDFRSDEQGDGLPVTIEVLADPLYFEGRRTNSIERALAHLEAISGYACDDTDLLMRSIWEAPKFEWADDDGWRPAEYDPADEWVADLDHREIKVARIRSALSLRDKEERLARLEYLLNLFSLPGEDPGFAALLLEWVCDRVPDFQLHCLAKRSRKQQCGRKKAEQLAA